jgi:hypothetical protein
VSFEEWGLACLLFMRMRSSILGLYKLNSKDRFTGKNALDTELNALQSYQRGSIQRNRAHITLLSNSSLLISVCTKEEMRSLTLTSHRPLRSPNNQPSVLAR